MSAKSWNWDDQLEQPPSIEADHLCSSQGAWQQALSSEQALKNQGDHGVGVGAFLLIHFYLLIEDNKTAQILTLYLGAIITIFTVILLSNEMIPLPPNHCIFHFKLIRTVRVAIGISQLHLTFLHICTQMFFKAFYTYALDPSFIISMVNKLFKKQEAYRKPCPILLPHLLLLSFSLCVLTDSVALS